MLAERLTPLDHSFLRVETPSAHMHVALRARFLPPAGSAPITLDRVAAMVASRLGLSPRFRQRLAFPPGGTPVWVDDADFDLRRHVFALGEGEESLTLKEFARRVDAELSLPLARDRPLWSLHVAPCLADGTVGILLKGHHAMVDGIAAVQLGLLLFDVDPAAPAGEPAPPPPRRRTSRS